MYNTQDCHQLKNRFMFLAPNVLTSKLNSFNKNKGIRENLDYFFK